MVIYISDGLYGVFCHFQQYCRSQCTYLCFVWSAFNQYPGQYSFKATGWFPTKRLLKKWTVMREEWILSLWLSSIFWRILAEPRIEPVTSCSQILYATDWAMGLGLYNTEIVKNLENFVGALYSTTGSSSSSVIMDWTKLKAFADLQYCSNNDFSFLIE